jgi:hypothetical protein
MYTIGSYSPGIARIEELAMGVMGYHDELHQKHPRYQTGEWMIWYSLVGHCSWVGNNMEAVGVERGRSLHHVALGRSGGRVHDIGKVHPDCEIYRRNGCISDDERLELRRVHPIYSEKWIVRLSIHTRESDQLFVSHLRQLVRHHHKPQKIVDPIIREIGFDLLLNDILVGLQEKRHENGRTRPRKVLALPEALDRLTEIVDRHKHSSEFDGFHGELDDSLSAIQNCFGGKTQASEPQMIA